MRIGRSAGRSNQSTQGQTETTLCIAHHHDHPLLHRTLKISASGASPILGKTISSIPIYLFLFFLKKNQRHEAEVPDPFHWLSFGLPQIIGLPETFAANSMVA